MNSMIYTFQEKDLKLLFVFLQRFETLLCIFIASAISHDYTNTGPIQAHLTRYFREGQEILMFLYVGI